MEYHPGGAEQLMRGAGIDATNLFDEYHAWVNIDQLLAKCFIGPLRNTVSLNLNDLVKNSSSSSNSKSLLPPEIPKPVNAKILPRFDWIQKKNSLSIYFYTKKLSNPGISIERISDREYDITIYVENSTHAYKFDFLKELLWKPTVKINQETGKIEISFLKEEEEELWTNFGIYEKLKDVEFKYTKYKIISKQHINHDSFELILRPKNDQMTNVAIGYHVNFKQHIFDKDVVRSYTPIPYEYFPKSDHKDSNDLCFIIKRYELGTLSKHIFDKDLSEILVSQQKGSFDLSSLVNDTNIGLLAAGSGLTPFLSIINYLLEINTSKM
jgi:cytochrome-b5 reductase